MDKTYYYLYKELYRHLYKFCIAGNVASKEAIRSMQDKINASKDMYLKSLYQMIICILDVRKDNLEFAQRKKEYEAILDGDDYLNRWCFYSVLLLIHKYIYYDGEQITRSEEEVRKATEELEKAGENSYQFDFEEADYAIQMHIDKKTTMYSAYDAEYAGQNFKMRNRSFLTILKGYSSSTPFFYSALREHFHNIPIKGGGIYIKWNGTGIVVDPGINFVENLHISGLSIKDIDVIIVTHNHIDHNGDLATIEDFASQLNKRDIYLYMDKKTEKDFEGRLVNFAEDKRKGLDLTSTSGLEFPVGENKDILIKAIPTKHIMEKEDYVLNETYAVRITLKEKGVVKAMIGITSDTIYLEELSEAFKDCDYVIANISETNKNDYLKKIPKENHLGYSGCLKLIKDCNKKKTAGVKNSIVAGNMQYIISEFWAGKGDIRRELVRRLRKESGYDYIYPGDIGMLFFLDQPTFICEKCGCEQSLEHLNIIRTDLEYSLLSTVCDECIL